MSYPPTFADAVETVRAWVNGQAALVGAGNPLPNGAHRWQEASPGEGAYALLVYAGGGPDGTEAPMQVARVSASVYAGTEAAARVAALAYANVLAAFDQAAPAAVTLSTDGSSVTVQAIDNITGPTPLVGAGDVGFLVDALFYLTPNP